MNYPPPKVKEKNKVVEEVVEQIIIPEKHECFLKRLLGEAYCEECEDLFCQREGSLFSMPLNKGKVGEED